MQTIYESHDFYTEFYLLGILGLVFTLFGLFGFGKSLDKTDMFFRLICLIPGFFMLYLALPYAKDYPAVQNKQYEIMTGQMTDFWITESGGSTSSASSDTSHFKIEDAYFNLDGYYKEFEPLIGFELQVSYLPHSRKVMKMEIPLTKENIEKANERFPE